MSLYGLTKTTLLDYPEHLAATLFIGGCNFLCPYCHNRSLVLLDDHVKPLPKEDILKFLEKKQGILEGICISGGEPTLYKELIPLIQTIKSMGYKVKLDTNGTSPHVLEKVLNKELVDYIAMDIKNSPNKYALTVGKNILSIDALFHSVDLIKSASIKYEFRTTVVKELHASEDFWQIGKWLNGAKAYYLQSFKPSENQIRAGFSSYSSHELNQFKALLSPYISYVALRGID